MINFNFVIKTQPLNSKAHNNLGNVFKEIKNYDEAINSYNKAININQNYLEAISNKADILNFQKKYENSLIELNKIYNQNPEFRNLLQKIISNKMSIFDWENFDDLTKKINSDLVGKLINLASRCSAFLEKNSDLMLSKDLEDEEKFKIFLTDIDEIKNFYSERKYSNAISKIMLMTDKANQYINEKKPWSIQDLEEVQKISTQGLNYFRTLVILLSPVMPDLQKKTEDMLNEKDLAWNDSFKPLLNKKIKKFVTLKNRIQKEDIQKLKDELTDINIKINVEEKSMTNEIEYDDFSKIDLRIGEILEAINVEGADKLLKLKVNLGDLGDKEIFAGIKKSYKPEDLIGMKTIVVANLKPKTMKFGTSSAMVLAASSDGEIIVIEADSKIKNGSKVK